MMYCPQCGKEQTDSEVRYCSRCGFQLSGVTDLLTNNGFLPHQMPNLKAPKPGISKRKMGMKNGAKLIFLSVVLLPLFFAFAVGAVESPAPLLVPFTIFLTGLCWLIYAMIFGDDSALASKPDYRQPFGFQNPGTALPDPDNYRVTLRPGQRVNTSEIVEPPSVTDHTTKFFDKG